MKIQEAMKKTDVLPNQASAWDAAQQMEDNGIKAIPVVDEDGISGVLTRKGVEAAVKDNIDLSAAPAVELTDPMVGFCEAGEEVASVLAAMQKWEISNLVVRDSLGEVVGVVNDADLIFALHNGGDGISVRPVYHEVARAG